MIMQSNEEFYNNFIKELSFTANEKEYYTLYENIYRPELGYLVRYSKKGYYDISFMNYKVCKNFSIPFDTPTTHMRFGTVYSDVSKTDMRNEPISVLKPSSFFVVESNLKGDKHWHKGQHFHGTEITIYKAYFDEILEPIYGDKCISLDEFQHNATHRYLPLEITEILRNIERMDNSFCNNLYMDSKILECIALITEHVRSSLNQPFTTKYDLVEITVGIRKMYLTGHDVQAIKKAYEIMTETACSPVTIEHLSSLVQINEQKLKAGFVSLYHTTIWKYANSIRMSNAASLLSTTKMSIQKIANNIGYSNCSNFTNMFKRSYHMTPREYRKLKNV